jgi:L-asparaginase / beta-aspartyl-peptidase
VQREEARSCDRTDAMVSPVIVVHGGAGRVARASRDAALAGVRTAAEQGRTILSRGGTAEDAVVAAVRSLEDDPVFNAGRGSCMTAAGTFEMDAGIMRSHDMRSGAVGAVPEVRDAIELARLVMQGDHRLIVGEGAARMAQAAGVGIFGRDEVWTEKAARRHARAREGADRHGQADTVGAVALDREGHTATACSTGGVLLKVPGRVGDSPLCGAGFYAAPKLGASCATGLGEAILTHVASYEVLRRIHGGASPTEAARAVCERVADGGRATCGLIVVLPDGRVAVAHASTHMSWAIARGEDPVEAGLSFPVASGPAFDL